MSTTPQIKSLTSMLLFFQMASRDGWRRRAALHTEERLCPTRRTAHFMWLACLQCHKHGLCAWCVFTHWWVHPPVHPVVHPPVHPVDYVLKGTNSSFSLKWTAHGYCLQTSLKGRIFLFKSLEELRESSPQKSKKQVSLLSVVLFIQSDCFWGELLGFGRNQLQRRLKGTRCTCAS